MSSVEHKDGVMPTETDVSRAKAVVGLIGRSANANNPIEFHARTGANGPDVRIPRAAVPLFLTILKEMADGHAVQVIAHERELTTQEAADILKVSRPYIVRLLDEERIPSHRVGSHRRVLYRDIKDYKAKSWSRRKVTLDKLATLDQELGLND
jgi:excisionase family DNA binding protein